jgi:hypothetical protein
MDEDGIPDVLKTERMGHEMPGMHGVYGVYGHVSAAMRADLRAALQERWENSLRDRSRLSPRSAVPTLDALLAAQRSAPAGLSSQNRTSAENRPGQAQRKWRLTCGFLGEVFTFGADQAGCGWGLVLPAG